MSVKARTGGRKPGRRKDQILGIASRLFQESGFDGVGMDDIGAAAGVSGPAIYSHFASKNDLLVSIMDRVADELVEVVDRIILEADDPTDAIRRLVSHHIDFALRERSLFTVWLREERNLPPDERRRFRLRQRYYLKRWVTNLVEVHPDMPVPEANSLVHGAFNFIASVAYYEPTLERDKLRALLQAKAVDLLLVRP